MRNIRAKFDIPNLPNLSQSPDIWQNSDGIFSDFWISGQSPIKVNCHNFRTIDDTDINLYQ